MTENHSYGILIVALVSITAVVGLVMFGTKQAPIGYASRSPTGQGTSMGENAGCIKDGSTMCSGGKIYECKEMDWKILWVIPYGSTLTWQESKSYQCPYGCDREGYPYGCRPRVSFSVGSSDSRDPLHHNPLIPTNY